MFGSSQSTLIIIIGIIIVYINQLEDVNIGDMMFQILGFVFLAYNANCLVTGGCSGWSWLTISLPLVFAIMYLLDYYYGPMDVNGKSSEHAEKAQVARIGAELAADEAKKSAEEARQTATELAAKWEMPPDSQMPLLNDAKTESTTEPSAYDEETAGGSETVPPSPSVIMEDQGTEEPFQVAMRVF